MGPQFNAYILGICSPEASQNSFEMKTSIRRQVFRDCTFKLNWKFHESNFCSSEISPFLDGKHQPHRVACRTSRDHRLRQQRHTAVAVATVTPKGKNALFHQFRSSIQPTGGEHGQDTGRKQLNRVMEGSSRRRWHRSVTRHCRP